MFYTRFALRKSFSCLDIRRSVFWWNERDMARYGVLGERKVTVIMIKRVSVVVILWEEMAELEFGQSEEGESRGAWKVTVNKFL